MKSDAGSCDDRELRRLKPQIIFIGSSPIILRIPYTNEHFSKNIIVRLQYRTADFSDLFQANVTSQRAKDRLLNLCNEIAVNCDSRRALIDNILE